MLKKSIALIAAAVLILGILPAGCAEPLFDGLRFGMTREEAEAVLARKQEEGLARYTSDREIFLDGEVYGCGFFHLTYGAGRLELISSYKSADADAPSMFRERSEKLRAVLGEPDFSKEKGTKAPVDFRSGDPAVVSWSAQTEDASFRGSDSSADLELLDYEQWLVPNADGDIWLVHHDEYVYRSEYMYESRKQTISTRQDEVELLPYLSAGGDVSAEDAALSLSARDNVAVLAAGQKLTLKAAFANTQKINKQAKNDTIVWELVDTATGKAPADITLDAKGAGATLAVPKKLAEARSLEIRVFSPVYHTSASWQLTAVPAISGIAAEPAELYFYTGSDTPQSVRAVITPDSVPPAGLTWTPAKKNIVEITETEPGTVSVKPLAAGRTVVTVRSPGGKSAKLNVSVVEPVESVELKVSGKPVPGGTVTVKETLLPKKAGNKKVEWSLDVGGDIATVSKGKVKIAKSAPAGTVITVTCTAPGAPEPVSASVRIIVAEK